MKFLKDIYLINEVWYQWIMVVCSLKMTLGIRKISGRFWKFSIVKLAKEVKLLWHVVFFTTFVKWWTCQNRWCVIFIKKGDPLVGFCGQHVLVIKKVMQQRRLEKWCGMDYLHHGWSIIQQSNGLLLHCTRQ